MLSKRIKKIKSSSIRKVFDLATKNKGEFINFAIGQPRFKVPDELKRAMADAVQNGANKYAPTQGIQELREKVAEKLRVENNIQASSDDIIITSGTSGGIFLALSSILNPGDEVIIPDPYFTLYKEIIAFLDGVPTFLDTYQTFRIDPEKLKRLITEKTKALIINSPNNPTGIVYSQKELSDLAKIAKKNNLLIISDEIYEKFNYDRKFFSVGGIYENTITLNGFSKSYAITGWRVGYAHAPGKIIQTMNKLQQYTFVCAPAPAQAALAKAFNVNLNEEYQKYRLKRDVLYQELEDKYQIYKPEGAFYLFVKMPPGRKQFVDELINHKLLVVPGEAFSNRNDYFRISFAVEDDALEKGIKILRDLA